MITRAKWLTLAAGLSGLGLVANVIVATQSHYHSVLSIPTTESVSESRPKPGDFAADANLSVTATLSHPVVPDEGVSTVYARFRVDASLTERGQTPLDVALVVDCSSSMTGTKIEQAKAAAHKMIEQVSPGSRIALVQFSNTVTSTVLLDDRAALHELVDRIEAHGGTNLEGGWQKATDLLHASARPGVQRRVLVLSDGMPTVGSSNPEVYGRSAREAALQGVSTTTFGIGLDFDEELLGAMALEGDGNFTFIDDGARIDVAVSEEVGGLMSTAAAEVKLTVEGGEGVVVERVLGFPTKYAVTDATASLGTLFAGSSRDVLVRMQVSGGRAPHPSLAATVVYEEPWRGKGDLRSRREPRSTTRTLEVAATMQSTAQPDPAGVDVDVLSRAHQVMSTEAVDAAMRAWRDHDRDYARRLLHRALARNDLLLERYGMSHRVVVQQDTLRSLLEEIVSTPSDSRDARRKRKTKKMNSIEIIRGDSM